ncbi:hypothetical protein ACHAPF_010292 [Botrytis cinerea]
MFLFKPITNKSEQLHKLQEYYNTSLSFLCLISFDIMFANNFKASDPSQILVVRDQEQEEEEEYLSDSDEMVNLGELVGIYRQHHVEITRLHEERHRLQEERRLQNNRFHEERRLQNNRLQEERRLENNRLQEECHRLHEERRLEIAKFYTLAAILAAVLLVFLARLLELS